MLNTFAVKRSLLNLYKTAKTRTCSRKRNYFHIVQSNIHYKQMVTASWSKSVTVDRGGRKGLRYCGIGLFLVRCYGNFCFKVRCCGFQSPSGVR